MVLHSCPVDVSALTEGSITFTIIIFLFIMTLSIPAGADSEMNTCPLNLPKSVGVWTRLDSARVIDSANIFDYMNGGGELYLAYRFNHMKRLQICS